jgi:hypothetical protein
MIETRQHIGQCRGVSSALYGEGPLRRSRYEQRGVQPYELKMPKGLFEMA